MEMEFRDDVYFYVSMQRRKQNKLIHSLVVFRPKAMGSEPAFCPIPTVLHSTRTCLTRVRVNQDFLIPLKL